MRRTIIAALLAATGFAASAADFAVGLNTLSWHSRSGYETVTPGLYVRGDGPLFGELGILRNSYGFTTLHSAIGYSHKTGNWDLSIAAGISYGYRDRTDWIYPDGSHAYYTYGPPKLNPLVLPSVGYRITEQWGARLFIIPALKGHSDTYCLSLAIERTF
jgi:hypothetical protein